MTIDTYEKYYRVSHSDGRVEIVRRDTYWDSGWKDPKEITRINEIEVKA